MALRTDNGRRLARVDVTLDLFRDLVTLGSVTPGAVTCVAGLPPGAVFMASTFDAGSLVASLFFYHASFAPVPDGEIPPLVPVAWHVDRAWYGDPAFQGES